MLHYGWQKHASTKTHIIIYCWSCCHRSAGCVINDLTDRKFDGYIERTKNRPLVSGKLSVTSAFVILFVLGLIALWIVWQLNWLCFYLALVGIGLTILYPFCKRFLAIPQMVLAITFNWGIIIAFAAVTNRVPSYAWLWLAVNMFWTLAYDSQYALCDVEDDQKLGLKSSAIYFGNLTPAFILFCQMQMLILLCLTGYFFELDIWFWCALPIVVVFYVYQTQLIQSYRANYFQAFANNKWIGLVIFWVFSLASLLV